MPLDYSDLPILPQNKQHIRNCFRIVSSGIFGAETNTDVEKSIGKIINRKLLKNRRIGRFTQSEKESWNNLSTAVELLQPHYRRRNVLWQ